MPSQEQLLEANALRIMWWLDGYYRRWVAPRRARCPCVPSPIVLTDGVVVLLMPTLDDGPAGAWCHGCEQYVKVTRRPASDAP